MSRLIHRCEDFALIGALISMLVMALVQIFLRNFFDDGIFWAESFLRVLVLWVAMLGAMVATRESNHISIDVISRYLSPRYSAFNKLLTNLISAAVCAVISYYAYLLVLFEYEDMTIAFAIVPNWVCQMILPIGFAVMSLRFLIQGVSRIRAVTHD